MRSSGLIGLVALVEALTAGGFCIDGGATSESFTNDFDGDVHAGAWMILADEYGGTGEGIPSLPQSSGGPGGTIAVPSGDGGSDDGSGGCGAVSVPPTGSWLVLAFLAGMGLLAGCRRGGVSK